MELNKIYNCDCLDFMSGGGLKHSVDLVLTDPPYKFEGHGRGIGATRKYLSQDMNKIGTTLDTDIYTDEFMDMIQSIVKTDNMIFFCNKLQIPDILKQAEKRKLKYDILVLCKTAPTPLCNNQRLPDRERCIHLYSKTKVKGNYHTKRGFWVAPNYKTKDIDHPTVKPLDVIKQIIENCSNEGDVIFDPYMGSGTTAVACKELNRNYIGCEINPEYVEIANNRLLQAQEQTRQQTLF